MYKTLKDVYGNKIQAIEILGGAVRRTYSETEGQFFVTVEFYKTINGKDVIIESYTNPVDKQSFIQEYNNRLNAIEIQKQLTIAEISKISGVAG